jgi:hypothetical protein
MQKYIGVLVLALGMAFMLNSCQCRTCKKSNEPNYTVCKNQGSQQDYDNTIAFLEAGGFQCDN